MRSLRRIGGLIPLCVLLSALAGAGPAEPTYVRKASRVDTILATLKASGLPTLEGAQLLIKVGNGSGDGAVYVAPEFPRNWPAQVRKRLARDFPAEKVAPAQVSAEAAHYRMVTLPVPKDVVLEVGGLAVRPDGKLLACTRRGEVWLIANPNSDDPDAITFKKFAGGLLKVLPLALNSSLTTSFQGVLRSTWLRSHCW